jgi:nucleotide-binding universal stress UspA family protein
MTYYSSPRDWDAIGHALMRRRIVHANDGSKNSFRALETALEIALAWRSTVRIVLVEEIPLRDGFLSEI